MNDENEKKERIPSQIDRILAVLESGGTLTALDALERFRLLPPCLPHHGYQAPGLPGSLPHGHTPQPLRQTVPRR